MSKLQVCSVTRTPMFVASSTSLRSPYSRRWRIAAFNPQIEEVQRLAMGSAAVDVSAVLHYACVSIVPNLERVDEEIGNVLNALEGRYVPAGPAGAPTRGMAGILPTGRNFCAVDPRALPSQAAWQVGQRLARETLARHLREENAYP